MLSEQKTSSNFQNLKPGIAKTIGSKGTREMTTELDADQLNDAEELKKLKKRSDLHLARKIWHIGGVSLIAAVYAILPHTVSVSLLAVAWVVFVPMDFARLKYPHLNKHMLGIFRPIMRQTELHKLAGTTYLLTGLLLVTLFFPSPIVFIDDVLFSFC